MKKVLVAMSGGVDSSVSALLLKEKGYDIRGVTMCLGVKGGNQEKASCCGPEAVEDAKGVCERLGVPHHIFDYAAELEEQVIKRFVSSYTAGTTPNPCIDCNRYLKFGILLKKAQVMGFDYLATGHYAAIEKNGSGYLLKRPRDSQKDQTYFLYPIRQEHLGSLLFPLAPFTKGEVRSMARRAGLSIYPQEVEKAIMRLHKDKRIFDIIFVDPPYYKVKIRDGEGRVGMPLPAATPGLKGKAGVPVSLAKNTLQTLGAYDILAPNGFIVVQRFKKENLPETLGVLLLFKQHKYADTELSFYKRAG